ncbi:MAG: hypothetical protein B6D54_05620 [Epsilonproteobacteria bacterium 4484_65]|nr:MAG: hypothetical protein B6D54_05620 [Epsilonproteobacteria bacterium 4484_65]
MTEKKIEALFHDAVIISDALEKNLYNFNQNRQEIHGIYTELEKLTSVIRGIAQYDTRIKKEHAQRFANEIKTQIDRYYEALKHVDLDTTSIELMIEQYNMTIQAQVASLESSAKNIANTLEDHANTIVATAHTLKKRKRSLLWDMMLFGSGTVVGSLFLAAYPITKATMVFHDELLQRDKQIQQLKEHYETNDKMIAFLKKHDITVKPGITNESWERESLRFAPMLLFNEQRIGRVDEINEYKRIVFKKREERN